MIAIQFFFKALLGLAVVAVTSCSWASQSGPLKKRIRAEETAFQLVDVKSRGDIPPPSRAAGLAEVPPPLRGQGYSDKVRPRDSLDFIITDLSEQSPFHSRGAAYKYGPIEVPEDGLVNIPYVGEIQVIDLSLAQVSAIFGEKIKPVSSTAEAAVVRTGRFPRTANVIGEVKNPGPVPLERSGLTSLDILASSGGPTESEHLFKYTVRRNGIDYRFDYQGFRRNPFVVEEGDLITVTSDTGNRFHVMGAINRPVTVPFPSPAPTLADALGAATGLDERRSDPSGIFVFRKGQVDTVYTFDLKDPSIVPLIQRFPIQGEDIVYITEAPLVRWNRMISQILPSWTSQLAGTAYQIDRLGS
jgi:polysaccharide export outer membrane protein